MTIQRPKKEYPLFSCLLTMRDKAHLMHLKTQSYAQHVALGDFYESLLGLTDNVIESYQGIYGLQDIKIEPFTELQDPVSELQKFYTEVESLKGNYAESWIVNEIDNISALTAKTLYKLRFLK